MSPSPEKKKRKKTTTTTKEPSLSNDSLLSCFSSSLVTSKKLFQIRTRTETCLYVCLWFPPDLNPHWFTLCRKPNQTEDTSKKKTKMSNGNVLIPIPTLNSLPVRGSSLLAIGSEIYSIGGSNYNFRARTHKSKVSVLDCQSHTWRKAPNLQTERIQPSSCVINGKIYVGGGSDNRNKQNSIEVFDTKTENWAPLHGPNNLAFNWRRLSKSVCIDGKFCFMNSDEGLLYDPKECIWDKAKYELFKDGSLVWNNRYCAIENIFYCYSQGMFKWYDTKLELWKIMKGFEGMPKLGCLANVKLVDYGAKMAVLWDKRLQSGGYKEKVIWCAVIGLKKCNEIREKIWCGDFALEKRVDSEIWGNVEWCEAVLNVPKSYEFESALALTV